MQHAAAAAQPPMTSLVNPASMFVARLRVPEPDHVGRAELPISDLFGDVDINAADLLDMVDFMESVDDDFPEPLEEEPLLKERICHVPDASALQAYLVRGLSGLARAPSGSRRRSRRSARGSASLRRRARGSPRRP